MFSLLKGKISILIPSNHCFWANFQKRFMFSVRIIGFIAIIECEMQKCGKISLWNLWKSVLLHWLLRSFENVDILVDIFIYFLYKMLNAECNYYNLQITMIIYSIFLRFSDIFSDKNHFSESFCNNPNQYSKIWQYIFDVCRLLSMED